MTVKNPSTHRVLLIAAMASNGDWNPVNMNTAGGWGESHSHGAPPTPTTPPRTLRPCSIRAGSTTPTTFSAFCHSPGFAAGSFLTLQLPPSSKQWTWFFFSLLRVIFHSSPRRLLLDLGDPKATRM